MDEMSRVKGQPPAGFAHIGAARARRSPGERPTLLCFPHAGGSAVFFRKWGTALNDLAEVVPIEPAGHGARRGEPLPQAFDHALDSVWATVARHAHRRYGLFGHSLGALYAFETARLLTGAGRPPALLVVSGRNGPSRATETPPCHMLPDTEFVAQLASYGGIPREVLNDLALVEFFLPVLRADMQIAERYARAGGPRLDCPIVALAGTQDPLISSAGVATWRQETTATCDIIQVAGDHFCLQSQGYLSLLRHVVAQHLPAGRVHR
jgi:surfactin synthase thioesterase subunit